MKILSIESSCDETSAAVVENNNDGTVTVLSNIIATSLELHATTGGIIPENAAREQIKFILPVIVEALLKSQTANNSTIEQFNNFSINQNKRISVKKTDLEQAQSILRNDIDAIAVTYGPGLIGSLLVGVETAKTLSYVFNKPLIPVNHLLAHIYANFIATELTPKPYPLYPLIGLIVSGGHTDLLYFKNNDQYEWLGGTRDDAAGECFDKCARLLGYDYPGGPKISKLAEKGDAKKINFPKLMTGDDFDFSFSGLKTAFMNVVRREFEIEDTVNEFGYHWKHVNVETLSEQKKQLLYDLCAGLEQTIIEVLVRKTLKAAEKYNCQTILLGGGVSANQKLIEEFKLNAERYNLNASIFAPAKKYATDNAAMIGAWAALNVKPESWQTIKANPELYFE